MGNINQGLGPLSDSAPFQISNAVFSDHRAHRFKATELIGMSRDGQQNIRMSSPVPTGQRKDGAPAF